MRIITLKMQRGIPRAQKKNEPNKKARQIVCLWHEKESMHSTNGMASEWVYIFDIYDEREKMTGIRRQKCSTFTYFRIYSISSSGFFFVFVPSANICLSNCQRIQNHKHTNPVRIASFRWADHCEPNAQTQLALKYSNWNGRTMKESDPKQKIWPIINERIHEKKNSLGWNKERKKTLKWLRSNRNVCDAQASDSHKEQRQSAQKI